MKQENCLLQPITSWDPKKLGIATSLLIHLLVICFFLVVPSQELPPDAPIVVEILLVPPEPQVIEMPKLTLSESNNFGSLQISPTKYIMPIEAKKILPREMPQPRKVEPISLEKLDNKLPIDNKISKQTENAEVAAIKVPISPTQAPVYTLGSTATPLPDYPWQARRKGIEGQVILEVVVSAQGHPETIAIIQSSGYAELDNSAQNALEKWRFSPAINNGVYVSSSITVPITFRLENVR